MCPRYLSFKLRTSSTKTNKIIYDLAVSMSHLFWNYKRFFERFYIQIECFHKKPYREMVLVSFILFGCKNSHIDLSQENSSVCNSYVPYMHVSPLCLRVLQGDNISQATRAEDVLSRNYISFGWGQAKSKHTHMHTHTHTASTMYHYF